MDQARVEFLLDDGWVLVGQFHQWLSEFPAMNNGRESVIELINGLQRLWSLSDDLKLKRISRVCLGMEQLLERFCSRNLAFSAEELNAVLTQNVSCLQELLLGFEAMREEPEFPDPESVRRLERFTLQSLIYPVTELIAVEPQATSLVIADSVEPSDETQLVPHQEVPLEREAVSETSVEDGLLTMLEQFVAQLDETCQRLHARMVEEEAPYVTTTSRLEHLAASTRELFDQLAQRSRGGSSAPDVLMFHESLPMTTLEDAQLRTSETDLAVVAERANWISDVALELNETIELDETTEFRFDDVITEGSIAFEPAGTAPAVAVPARRVLIVEESLFYRHLICMAVQSAGFEPLMADSGTQALEKLEHADDFSAILIGETVSAELAQAIATRRQSHGLKVVGITQTDRSQPELDGIDGHVLRSQPQQLVSILNTLLSPTADAMLLSA